MRTWFARRHYGLVVVLLVLCGVLLLRVLTKVPLMPTGLTELLDEAHAVGPEDAPLRIIEFSDMFCPSCYQAFGVLESMREDYGDDLRLVFIHYPLSLDAMSVQAAIAVECAGEQGRFEHFRAEAFARREALESAAWQEIAQHAGVGDLEGFAECVGEARYSEKVMKHHRVGNAIGVRGTPSYFIEGKLYVGVPDAKSLEAWIRHRVRH